MAETEIRFRPAPDAAELDEPDEVAVPEPVGESLEARMARRRTALESATTERFAIPGYESVVEVELRMLDYRHTRRIGKRHERVRQEEVRELYIAADSIIDATVAFFEVHGMEAEDEPTNVSWVSLARSAVPSLDANTTPRQAILALLDGQRLAHLADDWSKWMRSERGDVDDEQAEVFRRTR